MAGEGSEQPTLQYEQTLVSPAHLLLRSRPNFCFAGLFVDLAGGKRRLRGSFDRCGRQPAARVELP